MIDQQRIATVAVVGGGPGGLMAAYRMDRKSPVPVKVTLFEGSGRLGGKVLTRRFESAPNLAFEAGAAEFYDYSQLGPDPLRELIAELGLGTFPMQGGGSLFRNRILRSPEDVRRELGPVSWNALSAFDAEARAAITRPDYYESDWRKDNEEPLARMRFHELLRKVPDETARDYIQMMVHSDLACEPHQTSASYGLQNHLMDEADYMKLYRIEGGNERLTQELARRIRAEVRLEERVVRVERGESHRYRVTSNHRGRVLTADFDYVVIALPNDAIPSVAWGGELLNGAMNRHHQFYDHPAHYLRVTALFDRPFWRDRIGGSFFMSEAFGGCCLYDETERPRADSRGILGWLIAGEAALRLGNLDDRTLVEEAIHSLPDGLNPSSARLIESQVQRWAGSVNSLPGGFPAVDVDQRHQPEPDRHPRLFVMGDYLFDSTINGVLDSADTVVDWIVEELAAGSAPLAAPSGLPKPAGPSRAA